MRVLLVGIVASLVLAVAWRVGAEPAHGSASVDTAATSTHDHHRSAALPARVVHSATSALQVRRLFSAPAPSPGALAGAAATLTVLLAWVLVQSSRAASLHRRVVLAPLPSRAPPRRR